MGKNLPSLHMMERRKGGPTAPSSSWTEEWGGVKGVRGNGRAAGQDEQSGLEQKEAERHVAPPDQVKKKRSGPSSRAVQQSSDLVCFQEPSCSLLSRCASNREP